MHIAFDIPDNIPNVVATDQDPARAALEALVLEGYRSERLSEYDVQQLLGFDSRFDVHGFLKEHRAYMHMTMENIQRDTEAAWSAVVESPRRNGNQPRSSRMIVIADTSPLNYLIWIGEVEVLPALYARVVVPPIVCKELSREGAPDIVSE